MTDAEDEKPSDSPAHAGIGPDPAEKVSVPALLPSAERFLSEAPAAADDILYHYTSPESLLKIVSSKQMWATGIRHLNDSSEYRYGHALLPSALASAAKNRREAVFLGVIASRIGPFSGLGLGQEPVTAELLATSRYVVSFSKNHNQLSQWRAYCPKAGGYSIGFSVNELLSAIGKQQHDDRIGNVWRLARCIYKEAQQMQLLTDLMEDLLQIHRNTFPRVYETPPPPFNRHEPGHDEALSAEATQCVTKRLEISLDTLAPLFKHPKFSEEDEWRLISPRIRRGGSKKTKFRAGTRNLVTYLEFELPKNDDGTVAIRRIVIGPTESPPLAHFTLDQLFDNIKPHDQAPAISESGIPYRE